MAGQFKGPNPRLTVPLSYPVPVPRFRFRPSSSSGSPQFSPCTMPSPKFSPCTMPLVPSPYQAQLSVKTLTQSLCSRSNSVSAPTVYQAPAPSRSLVSKHNLSLAGLYQASALFLSLAGIFHDSDCLKITVKNTY